jgi:hypothetical protein
MILKGFRYRVPTDPRGDISSGKRNEKGLPEKLPYFNVEDFPELVEIYGPKPTELILFFPTDNPNDFLSYRYERWGAKGDKSVLIRYCDCEECVHRIAEDVGGVKYEAGEVTQCVCDALPQDDRQLCTPRFWFKAFVAHPQTLRPNNPLTYRFHSSRNSAEHIISALLLMKDLNMGVLRNIPFRLTVTIVQDQVEAKKNFPVWNLTPIGMLDEIRETTRRLLEECLTGQKVLPVAAPAPAEKPPVITAEEVRKQKYPQYITRLQQAPSLVELKKIGEEILKKKDQFTPMDLDGFRAAYEMRFTELTGMKPARRSDS